MTERHRPTTSATFRGFTVLWALAAVFHLMNTGAAVGLVSAFSANAAVHAVVGVAALMVLAHPGDRRWFGLLSCATIVSAWTEAPVIGNHWLLAALIALGFLLASAYGRFRLHRDTTDDLFIPIARFTLLAFYYFAAFSKLNSGFIDSHVSCGNFFAAETFDSLHLPWQWLTGTSVAASATPWLVIAIELAIPTLLLIPKTRNLGVLVGLVFHSVIALDLSHFFGDFSSVLTALFLLFLPDTFFIAIEQRMLELKRVIRYSLWTLLVAIPTALVIALWFNSDLSIAWRMPQWFLLDAVVFVAVVHHLRTRGGRATLAPAPVPRVWLALVPMLAVFNGITPYLDIKTGYSWNMYSNLTTYAGNSNHLLIRGTARLTGFQGQMVRIDSSDDANVETYAQQGFLIPMLQLRAYLSQHSNDRITYTVNGATYRLAHASQDQTLVSAPPEWELHVFSFRAVDSGSPARCQPGFMPLN